MLLVEQAPGIQYGISFMQEALRVSIGKAGAIFLAVMLFIFIFTTMLSLFLSAGIYLQISVGRE